MTSGVKASAISAPPTKKTSLDHDGVWKRTISDKGKSETLKSFVSTQQVIPYGIDRNSNEGIVLSSRSKNRNLISHLIQQNRTRSVAHLFIRIPFHFVTNERKEGLYFSSGIRSAACRCPNSTSYPNI